MLLQEIQLGLVSLRCVQVQRQTMATIWLGVRLDIACIREQAASNHIEVIRARTIPTANRIVKLSERKLVDGHSLALKTDFIRSMRIRLTRTGPVKAIAGLRTTVVGESAS